MKLDKFLKRYRIEQGKHFHLKDCDPADTHGLESELKPKAKEWLAKGVKELSRLQGILAAQDRWGLLLGLGLYWKDAAVAAVVVFVLALICLLAGTLYYIREVTVSLSSVRNEARDARFMDLGDPPEIRVRDPL